MKWFKRKEAIEKPTLYVIKLKFEDVDRPLMVLTYDPSYFPPLGSVLIAWEITPIAE